MRIRVQTLIIAGMTCANCQRKIEKMLLNTPGVQAAKVSYSSGSVSITYDADAVSLQEICLGIEELGYKAALNAVRRKRTGRAIGVLFIIFALFAVLEEFGILNMLAPGRLADAGTGLGMLLVIGLMTSVHCVAMCGGINISQCVPPHGAKEGRFGALWPSLLYNLGRVISYTSVGFIVGALGSAITFSNTAQGVLKLIAGIFMVIMGLNMLDIFPWLRKLAPRLPKVFTSKAASGAPLVVGLLNGLMPCGPLQAMQIYALSTGRPAATTACSFPRTA